NGVNVSTNQGSINKSTDSAYVVWVSGPDTAVSSGQRVRIRVYIDDESDNPLTSAQTVTLTYSGSSAAAAGDSWAQFTQTITEFTPTVTIRPTLTTAPYIPATR